MARDRLTILRRTPEAYRPKKMTTREEFIERRVWLFRHSDPLSEWLNRLADLLDVALDKCSVYCIIQKCRKHQQSVDWGRPKKTNET